MHETKEIRWFFRPANKHIENWFGGLDISTVEKRTDFYLTQRNQNIGIKLRDGKVDIKQRIGTRGKDCLNPDIWGHFDRFVKWSFNVDSQESPYTNITEDRSDGWLTVDKERRLVQLTQNEDGTIIKSVHDDVNFGCQIEYSRIKVEGEVWHTIALEYFGNQCLKSDQNLISKIFGDTKLSMQQSFGYSDFLDRYQNTGKTEQRYLEDSQDFCYNS